jgi:hypothetical protein
MTKMIDSNDRDVRDKAIDIIRKITESGLDGLKE